MTWGEIPATYDRVAGVYEQRFANELDGKPRDRELLTAFARSVADPVVEIGCGPGHVGAFARNLGRRVVGLDLSPGMARLAAARLDGVVAADMRRLPLRDDLAGGIIAFYSVIHLRREEVGTAMSEFARVLAAGGRLLVSAHEGDGEVELDEFLGEPVPIAGTYFRLDELVDLVRAAGLAVEVAEQRPPYATEGPTNRLYVQAFNAATR